MKIKKLLFFSRLYKKKIDRNFFPVLLQKKKNAKSRKNSYVKIFNLTNMAITVRLHKYYENLLP